MMLKTIAISLALTLAAAAPLSAQAQGTKAGKIPAGQRPPAGMCRIWLDGVPPGQQPAPTDCATAVRNRPANGRVIFGDDYIEGRARKLNGDADQPRTAPREQRDSNRANDDARRGDRKEKPREDNGGKGTNRKARPRDTARTDGDH